MTLAAIIIPKWISFDNDTVSCANMHSDAYLMLSRITARIYTLHTDYTSGAPTRIYPLYHWASTSSLKCVKFPEYSDCHGDERYFCSMWRSVGFLMSFAVVIEGMTIAAFVVLLAGGKQRREQGWGVLAILVALAAGVQVAGTALTVRESDSGAGVG